MTIILVGLLGFFSTFYVNFGATRSTAQRDEAGVALDTASETLRNADFDTLYSTYHGTSIAVPQLQAPKGGAARIDVICFVDETSLPAEFGPILDINGSGGLQTTDCSSNYKLLPVRLQVT